MRVLRAIHIESHIYFTTMQDTSAGQEELAKARRFVTQIEQEAAKYLPAGRHILKIIEEFENS